ncbi:MAG TPA: hypothetical protein DDY13_14915 [Cytophagales bacterium]|jgi:predicted RND superfamily exporter protein|nr:hypothetical protein [Cytophagales bacterium]
MWTKLAHIVLKHRVALIVILAIITAFMGYQATKVQWSYTFAQVVPDNDPDMQYYKRFKRMFGEDGNMLALGVQDSALYQLSNFESFAYLSDNIRKIRGVSEAISIPDLRILYKDTVNRRFDWKPVFDELPESQSALDSLLGVVEDLKFYSNQLLNVENGATFILVSINKETLNSAKRDVVIEDIKHLGEAFTNHTGIDLHYVGLPYIRSEVNGKIKIELQIFLILSLFVTALILLFFFRSWDAVVFPMIIILTVVVWSMGTLSLFGYKITMLTGLLPPIIAVIGIPNSIYLLNKYHQEIDRHGNQMRGLSTVISKIGLVTLITNCTTAIGFLVLGFTKITILREFGIVAGINILAAFIVSIIMIPVVFSFLPKPHGKQLKHLKFKGLNFALAGIDLLVHRHRYSVIVVTIGVVVLSVIGFMRLHTVAFMVDDVPEKSEVKQDLEFFERNFSGIMPLEIEIDLGRKGGVRRLSNLRKVEELEDYLSAQPYISEPVSVVGFFKAARQAYYNNSPRFYSLPNRQDKNFILPYLAKMEDSTSLVKSFMDSTQQIMRSSYRVADIGSNKLDSLIDNVIQTKIDSVFKDSDIKAKATGTTLLFVKGNQFLVQNLQMSLLLAFVIIAIIMGFLFRNPKMVMISIIPNIIPLLITAGLMGAFDIPLKPSTALIFSVVFGISVDDSIHFLAKYRQELFQNRFFVPLAISKSIRETGASMMYTSIILFAGFVIFAISDFGGTKYLGILTSITLLIAMFTNLLVLPSLLLIFDDGKRDEDAHPPIEHYDEFYEEAEDEEINLELIVVNKSQSDQPMNK